METVIHNVGDLSASGRNAAESLVGHPLAANQRLLIQVLEGERPEGGQASAATLPPADRLPDWCDIYGGLSDDDIAALEQFISRRLDLTRPRA